MIVAANYFGMDMEITINRHECNEYRKENYYEESNISSYGSSMYVMYGDSM